MKKNRIRSIITVIALLICAVSAYPKQSEIKPEEYKDIVYKTADGYDLKLDVFKNASSAPAPVLIYFHGGGWVSNARAASWSGFRFYLSLGMSVVNVDYRLAAEAKAPGAVEDVRASLLWVAQNAAKYNFDVNRIVCFGTSAGGHLALMAGMTVTDPEIDRVQKGKIPHAAAILDFYGITDVADLLDGSHKRGWANTWIGNGADRKALAVKMSPLSYIGNSTPPVFIVHGDSDPTVPYEHALRLKKALDEKKIRNVFFPVPGGLHGNFTKDQMTEIQQSIGTFLKDLKIVK